MNIQSSKSGLHFDHYKAISFNDDLSALQVAKFNLAIISGQPLQCWGNGVTVLLEKVFGEIFVDKLRAICLLEADFNWLTKLVFAKRMMIAAKEKGIIPVDQFAKPGTSTGEGIMAKTFFNDIHRTTHWPSSVTSVDLSQC